MKPTKLKALLGTRTAIVGMGKSGVSALKLINLFKSEFELIETFDDAQSSPPPLSQELLTQLDFDSLVVSPGIPLSRIHSLLTPGHRVRIVNEIDLATCFLETEIVIGVTGSVGKSTTVSLLGSALRSLDPDCFVGGNLGIPFCEYAIALVNGANRAKYIALELSSYQIESLQVLDLDIAAITSLVPNHLERYRDKAHYFETKLSLHNRSKSPLFLNQNGGELRSYLMSNRTPLINPIWTYPELHKDFNFSQMTLMGSYNHDNCALVISILKHLNIFKDTAQALLTFAGLPHRLEKVTCLKGVTYINDSKATAIQSVLESVFAVKPYTHGSLHLLLGGRDKKLDWERLNELSSLHNIKFYFFGESKDLIPFKTQLQGERFDTLKTCLESISSAVQAGDTVLLSPGGTSLDEFSSFEERGQSFKSWALEQA